MPGSPVIITEGREGDILGRCQGIKFRCHERTLKDCGELTCGSSASRGEKKRSLGEISQFSIIDRSSLPSGVCIVMEKVRVACLTSDT